MNEDRFSPKFLELSKFDSESRQGYDEKPDFLHEVWPLFASHAPDVASVVSWRGPEKPRLSRLIRRHAARREVELRDHGPMAAIGADLQRELRERSHWGGHLSVLIATSNVPLLRSLIALYRRAPAWKEGLAELELPKLVFEEISRLVLAHGYVVTFGHDGDPTLIISTYIGLQSLTAEFKVS